MPPLVSVLVTVYNREKYIAACIESILGQSFRDFEVVIVDDCSKDHSIEMARRYESDSRVKIHLNHRNLGDYPNRNRAASLAQGKYLKYVDADDLIYPHSLAVMVEAMERFSTAGLALSCNIIDPEQPYPFCSEPAQVYRGHFLGRSVLGVGPSAAIIRTESFHAVGGFSNRQFVGDTELWLKLAARWPVVSLPPSLVWWRRHEDQQMTLEMSKPEVLDIRFRLGLSVLDETTLLTSGEKRLAQRRQRQHHARRLLCLAIRSGQPRTAWQLIKKSRIGFRELLRGLRPYQP